MVNTTRRRFLATAGAGAAAVGIGAVVPVAMSGNSRQSATAEAALVPEAAQMPHNASGQLVAWIGDVHDDTITLMVGDRDVTVHDRDLVARLAANAF